MSSEPIIEAELSEEQGIDIPVPKRKKGKDWGSIVGTRESRK